MKPEDDAMDLNDEGVEAAAKAISSVRYTAARQRANGQFVDEQDEFKRMALAAAPYLRAVPESDELVRLRALLDEASRSSHQSGQLFTKGAMHPGPWERCEAMSCSDARAALSPNEAAGDE